MVKKLGVGNPFDFRMFLIGKLSNKKERQIIQTKVSLTTFERLYYKMGFRRRDTK